MSNIIYSAIAIVCGIGTILCTGLFLAFASAMQKQEGTQP